MTDLLASAVPYSFVETWKLCTLVYLNLWKAKTCKTAKSSPIELGQLARFCFHYCYPSTANDRLWSRITSPPMGSFLGGGTKWIDDRRSSRTWPLFSIFHLSIKLQLGGEPVEQPQQKRASGSSYQTAATTASIQDLSQCGQTGVIDFSHFNKSLSISLSIMDNLHWSGSTANHAGY